MRKPKIWLYNAVAGLPFLFGCIGLLLIVIVDPYLVRSTGLIEPKLGEHRYPDTEWARLINVTSSAKHDTVLLGGSTVMMIDTTMLREAFPESQSPVNLSYTAPRPPDIKVVLSRLGKNTALKRIVIVMDFSLLDKSGMMSGSGQFLEHLERTNWSKAMDFSLETAAASLHRIVFGTYSLPWWSQRIEPDFMIGAGRAIDNPSLLARLKLAVIKHKSSVFDNSQLRCNDIPFIPMVLVPFLDELKEKEIVVELVFPPLPYTAHYDWIDNRPLRGILLLGPVFDQLMTYKKCVVFAVEDNQFKNVRILAADSDDGISGDLNNYMDGAHLQSKAAFQKVLIGIVEGREQLTRQSLKSHELNLRKKVSRTGDLLRN